MSDMEKALEEACKTKYFERVPKLISYICIPIKLVITEAQRKELES